MTRIAVLFLAVTQTIAGLGADALIKADYTCRLERGKLFKKNTDYTLSYSLTKGVPTIRLATEAGRFLEGKKQSWDIAFLIQAGDFYARDKFGYAMFSRDDDEKRKATLTVATQIDEGTYENAAFLCEAAEDPKVAKVTRFKRVCTTDKELVYSVNAKGKTREKTHRIELRFSAVGAPINSLELDSIRVTPRSSYLGALTENTSFAANDKIAVIKGDSDGFYEARMELSQTTKLKAGKVKTISGSEEIAEDSSDVTCE